MEQINFIEGLVVAISDQSGTKKDGSHFTKWLVVIETTSTNETSGRQYADNVAVEFFGETLPDYARAIGTRIKVFFRVTSRAYNGKWYTSVIGTSCQTIEMAQPKKEEYDKRAEELDAYKSTVPEDYPKGEPGELPF